MKVFASHNTSEEIRKKSSSGGIFTLLAEKIISEGGVVYGAAFNENWKVEHRRVTNIDNLAPLRGSKYVYSNVGSCYNKVIEDLEAGRKVLFSGTPCQVAAVRKRAGEHPNLLLVEVVCHGAPEPKYWEQYLNELCAKHHRKVSDISYINFRDKRTGWKNYSFTLRFKDGKEISHFHGNNIYIKGFQYNLILRNACFNCHFKYPDGSKADITLGDFWGFSGVVDNMDDIGLSIVVCNTDFGLKMINKEPKMFPIRWEQAINGNSALIHPAVGDSKKIKKFICSLKKGKSFENAINKLCRPSFAIMLKIKIAALLKSLLI